MAKECLCQRTGTLLWLKTCTQQHILKEMAGLWPAQHFHFTTSTMVQPYFPSIYKDKDSLMAGWRAIHTVLASTSAAAGPAADVTGYAVYYYAVYKAFGQAPDAGCARKLLDRQLRLLAQSVPAAHSPAQLDQLAALAWLHTELVQQNLLPTAPHADLAMLDARLMAEASHLVQQPTADGRAAFLRIVRYFHERLAAHLAPDIWPRLMGLLAQALTEKPMGLWFPFAARSVVGSAAPVLHLGLAEGLAGELLLLLRLAEAGIETERIKEQVRQGILYILSAKREVDFSEKKYAIFPDFIGSDQDEATFSSELSWRHGDLGQALLLYHGHSLLEDKELLRLAELVGLNTLLRTDVRSTAVTNSRFSSGAAGVAHLYRTLYQRSGQEAYRKGYAYWLTQTRSWLTHELATDFYRHHEGDLLHGLVGVGLVMLSAISEQDLRWDRVL